MNMFIAGTQDSIVMVEGAGEEISEEQLLDAFRFAHPYIQKTVSLLNEIVAKHGLPKRPWAPRQINPELMAAVNEGFRSRLDKAIRIVAKREREVGIDPAGDIAKAISFLRKKVQ
jgi:polyribonucleotide nucleotidyltransferase